MAKETFEFQAETKQLLDLMVHSIYTNHEISSVNSYPMHPMQSISSTTNH